VNTGALRLRPLFSRKDARLRLIQVPERAGFPALFFSIKLALPVGAPVPFC